MMRTAVIPSTICALLLVTEARAEETTFSRWADGTALTTEPERLELGLVSRSAYAPNDWLELRAHPLAALVLPSVDAKVRWWSEGNNFISTRHGLTYPSLFLNVVAREGTGGLLPPDEPVPQALMLRSDVLATRRLATDGWVTLEFGAEVAPRTENPVLLDFPFLYQRFAALDAPLVPHVGVDLAWGFGHLSLQANARYDWLLVEDVDGAFALETAGEASWSFTDEVALSVLGRAAWARFPVGTRFHWFPMLDLRMAF